MDLTGKASKYISKRLRQKGLVKNTSSNSSQQLYPPTMQQVMSNVNNSEPTLASPFKQAQSVQKQSKDNARFKSQYEWLFDPVKGVAWDFNPVQLRELAQDDAWVQMLVNTMTTEIANTPWQIVEDDNSEVAKSLNPFERRAKGKISKQANDLDAKAARKFLQQPNPDNDFTTFIEQLVADYLEIGSMVAPKAFSENDYGGEKGNQLINDNPQLVHVTTSDPATFTKDYKGKTGIIKGYWQYDRNVRHRSNSVIGRGGARRSQPIQFDRIELAWKDINPRSNRRYGLPPTLAVRDILMLLDMTVEQEQDYWSRGAFPNGMIKSNGDIEEIGQLQDEAQGERGRQGGILHVSDPDAEWIQMASNWKDMEMTEREKWYAKIIASEFQVPMSVVGLKPEDVNRSTFEGERDNFESNTLGPYLQDIERWLTQNIIKPHFSEDHRFEFAPGTSENQKSSISSRVSTEFDKNLITRNEARQQLGYDQLEDKSEDGFKDDVVEDTSEGPLDQLQQSAGKQTVGKPFGPWNSFQECTLEMQQEQGYSEEEAKRVCGSLQAELKEDGKVEKQESFTDYPDAAVENAKMALEAKKDTGDPNDCGTDTGWARANQLANREPLSRDTVERMSQFSRHQDNSEMSDEEGRSDCGWMMWKAWGGDEGIEWAENKIDELEENEEKSCDQCGGKITKDENKRFCSKECYHDFLSKEEDEDSLRSDEEWFKYDFQPRHVEQFKEQLQEPINESLNRIFRDDRFQQIVNSFAEKERTNNTQKNSAELRRILNDLIKDAALTDSIEDIISDQSSSIAVEALQDQIADTGLDADIDEVTKRLQNRKLGFVQDFSQRMEQEIRDTVSQGWQQGQTVQEIQENLQTKADDLSDNQAERIARDQLQRATGEARNEFANQHSDLFVEVWDHVSDNRTRPAHEDMGESKAWKYPHESFQVAYERANGTVKEKYPGDSEYGIQCRCRTNLLPKEEVVNNSSYEHRGV